MDRLLLSQTERVVADCLAVFTIGTSSSWVRLSYSASNFNLSRWVVLNRDLRILLF
jgi:hypothetical protein